MCYLPSNRLSLLLNGFFVHNDLNFNEVALEFLYWPILRFVTLKRLNITKSRVLYEN